MCSTPWSTGSGVVIPFLSKTASFHYSTPWSRTVRVYSTPGVDLERNKCYSVVDPRLLSNFDGWQIIDVCNQTLGVNVNLTFGVTFLCLQSKICDQKGKF